MSCYYPLRQVALSFLSADQDGLSFADGTTLLSFRFSAHVDAPLGVFVLPVQQAMFTIQTRIRSL